MLVPTFLVTGVFVFYPIVNSFIISFFNWNMLSPVKRFVGLQNYWQIFHDPLFLVALRNTLFYAVCYVPVVLALGLIAALALNQRIRGSAGFRTILIVPYVTSIAGSGVIWQWIFEPNGVLNALLRYVGIPPQNWLNDPHWTLFNIIVMGVWQQLGYVSIIYLSGLQAISKEYYEAASVDGARSWHMFRHITWPLLTPSTYFLLILTSINALGIFLQVYVLYGQSAGPNNSAMTLVYYMYMNGFSNYRMGYASAAAYVFFFLVLIITLIQLLYSRRVNYDS